MTHFEEAVLQPLLWFLAGWSLRWGLIIGLLGLGFVLVRPRRAAVRHAACWAVLMAGLALPAMPRWGSGLRLPMTESAVDTVYEQQPAGEAPSAVLASAP